MAHFSILRGTDGIIDEFFGISESGKPKRYKTTTTFQNCNLVRQIGDVGNMLDRLYAQLNDNWASRSYRKKPSAKNWRSVGATHYNQDRNGKEVIVEREIVKAFQGKWINCIPTSSGLCGPSHDKARNVDLIHLIDATTLGFYELKWKADTPIFAAIEIILRGLLYLFTRQNIAALGYDEKEKPLLRATVVHLRVLAPWEYYHAVEIDLAWLEELLHRAVRSFFCAKIPTLTADFEFEMFPKGFDWPPFVNTLREAVLNRIPAYTKRDHKTG